jgi:hypothetical protein
MKSIARVLAGAAMAFAATAAFGQMPVYEERPHPSAAYPDRAAIAQPELDQILAAVALYPDPLLSQLLMAATYPRDVAEAARWSRDNPGLQGDDAVRAVERERWEPSVKSLVAFPEILAMMDARPDWTQRLGDAFLANEGAVMQTVQELRRRADEAGNLRSGDHIVVERTAEAYVIEQASPEIVYVPYYDPRVVYGSWWWPDYEPVFWSPWPGYAYYSGIGFGWGRGVRLHRGFFYGGFDWGRRHLRYSGHRPYYYSGNNYWRGWRDHRHDGRRYANDRSPGYAHDRSPGYTHDRSPGTQRLERREHPRYERRDWPRGDGATRASNTPRAERADGSIRRYEPSARMERADADIRRYQPSARTVAPRYDIDRARSNGPRNSIERSAQGQHAVPMPRAARVQPSAPVAGVHGNGIARTAPAAPAVQSRQQAAQPSHRPGNHDRGGGHAGGNPGSGRGRDR